MPFDLYGYWPSLLAGAWTTVTVALASVVIALTLGLSGALAKLSRSRVAAGTAAAYTTVIRGVPDLVLMLLIYFGGQIFVNWVAPMLGHEDYIDVNPWIAGVLTIGFIYGAYMTETFRGAILAVPKGQIEAAEAYGMSRAQVLFNVLAPQMIRHALPGLTNNWLVLMKTTALVSVIGLDDIVRRADLAGKSVREPFLFFIAVALVYLLFTSATAPALQRLEGKEIKPFHRLAWLFDRAARIDLPALQRLLGWVLRGLGYALVLLLVSGFVWFLAFGFDWGLVWRNLPWYFAGTGVTLALVAAALVLGLALAIPLSIARCSANPLLNGPVWVFTYVFRGTPLLVQLYVVYYGFSQFEGLRESWAWVLIDEAWKCALITFTLNTAAYTAEILRGAIQRTPLGEVEAARACGMSRALELRRILLPSAMRRALPAYGNEMIFMLHGSAVASIVTVEDLLGVARIINSRTYAPYEAYLTAGVFYCVLTFAIVLFVRWLEARYLRHLRARPDQIGAQPAPVPAA